MENKGVKGDDGRGPFAKAGKGFRFVSPLKTPFYPIRSLRHGMVRGDRQSNVMTLRQELDEKGYVIVLRPLSLLISG